MNGDDAQSEKNGLVYIFWGSSCLKWKLIQNLTSTETHDNKCYTNHYIMDLYQNIVLY